MNKQLVWLLWISNPQKFLLFCHKAVHFGQKTSALFPGLVTCQKWQ